MAAAPAATARATVRLLATLRQAGLATLLCDLLTEDEASDRRNVFDISLLGRRLEAAVHCIAGEARTAGMPVGLFGASTGAAAALVAAAGQPATVGAVVSRGGRPDLAGEMQLRNVGRPDPPDRGRRGSAGARPQRMGTSWMRCPTELAIVPGATHLFEEAGALEQVADLAAGWFRRWLVTEAGHAQV